jgi:hypothetical protein
MKITKSDKIDTVYQFYTLESLEALVPMQVLHTWATATLPSTHSSMGVNGSFPVVGHDDAPAFG